MKPDYIFVVGSFRSGTTLVRNMLDSTDEIAICWETHFWGHFVSPGYRKEIRKFGDLANDSNAIKAVDYIFTLNVGYWNWFQKNVDKEAFTARLLETDRSDKAIFSLLMEFYARGKPIWGEKTPAHLYHVSKLLHWFPNAKVIHTLRDPRAIFVSEMRKKSRPQSKSVRHRRLAKIGLFIPYILLQVTLTWLRATYLHKRYERRYPGRYFMIRFEDIIRDPEGQLENLSEFLEIRLSPRTLQDVRSNSSYKGSRGKSGLDLGAADRWRSYASPWVDNWFQFWFKKRLRYFGYQ